MKEIWISIFIGAVVVMAAWFFIVKSNEGTTAKFAEENRRANEEYKGLQLKLIKEAALENQNRPKASQ